VPERTTLNGADIPLHESPLQRRRHLEEVEQRIAKLDALRSELQRMVSECGHGRVCDCRVIQVLADHAQCAHDHH
jgi:hypothetical protein